MKVAVTGISGYLGGLVASRLEADSDVESILGLDLHPPDFASRKLAFRQADVRYADFSSLLQGSDVLLHLAFIVDPPRRMKVETMDAINIHGSERVFAGAVEAGVKRIIFASSIAAYGSHPDNPECITEECALRPNQDWYYSRAKGRLERSLDELQRQHPDIVVIRLRPCIFVGPRMNNTLRHLVTAKRVPSFRANLRTNYCWDEDVAEAFRLALHHPRSDAFNLAGDGALTNEEIARLLDKPIVRVSPRLLEPVLRLLTALRLFNRGLLEWFVTGFAGPLVVSGEKAKRVLGWKPTYDSRGALLEAARRTRPPAG